MRTIRVVLPVDWIVSGEPLPEEFAIEKELLDTCLYYRLFDVNFRKQANKELVFLSGADTGRLILNWIKRNYAYSPR